MSLKEEEMRAAFSNYTEQMKKKDDEMRDQWDTHQA